MSRKVGQTEVTVDEIKIIVEMSLSKDPIYTRKEISERINRSLHTIWRYQKELGLI